MTSSVSITISPTTPSDLPTITALFTAYATSLPISLSYQSFPSELASLPGSYSSSRGGALLLARRGGQPVGCIALRAFTQDSGEIKRLYVTDAARGCGVGRALMRAVLQCARERGYARVCLDTLPSMKAAVAMYRGLGFGDIEPYYDTPVDGTVFLGLELE